MSDVKGNLEKRTPCDNVTLKSFRHRLRAMNGNGQVDSKVKRMWNLSIRFVRVAKFYERRKVFR